MAHRLPLSQRDVIRRLHKINHKWRIRPLPDGHERQLIGQWHTSSTFFGTKPSDRPASTVHVLLPQVTPSAVFAGVKTALGVAIGVAKRLDFSLCVVGFDAPPSKAEQSDLITMIHRDFGMDADRIRFGNGWRLDDLDFSTRDLWIATYWSTAHALDVASRLGVIDAATVLYLVQDYEPAFFTSPNEISLAQSTYHAGFRMLVNSSPLQRYLEQTEQLAIAPTHVFRPELDIERLADAAGRRHRGDAIRVGFYGRPSKPRNLFPLGVDALRRAASRMDGRETTYFSMGEDHHNVDLGTGTALRSVGRVSWGEYFTMLAKTDVLLSLQSTPHPSHPPLDAVVSGGIAVTNDVQQTRFDLHPRLHAVDADPVALGDAVASACAEAASTVSDPTRRIDIAFLETLGHPLEAVLDSTASALAPAFGR